MDGAASARVAGARNRALGRELLPDDEEAHADLAQEAGLRDPTAWKKFDVYAARNVCNVSKKIVQTRLVLTWKMVDAKESVQARLVAKGFQYPDPQRGIVDTTCCVGLRSSHLQVISLRAIEEWELWSLDIKNAFLQADGFTRGVFLQGPLHRNRCVVIGPGNLKRQPMD